MASTILLLFLSALSTANAQHRNFNLSRGSSLSPTGNSSLLSRSGLFAFGFFPSGDGFAVGIWFEKTPHKTVLWTVNRNDPLLSRDATVELTGDGRLILQELGRQKNFINSVDLEPAFFASLLDSGNFVLCSSNSTIIWRSFDYPTDTVLPGQLLRAGNQLVSSISQTNHSEGDFRIEMQDDGNIVIYPVISSDAPYYAYWATNTYNFGENVTLTLDRNGRLYLLNSSGVNIMNITPGVVPSDGKTYRATLDADGLFRLYSLDLRGNSNWSIEWYEPSDRCAPKTICGINAYCDLIDQQPVCSCPPGFVFINQKQRNLGCYRNFTAESCAFKNEHTKYSIEELQNTVWGESTYSIVPSETKEQCSKACLEDCTCEAACFQGQECLKQKLPLTFGRRQPEESYTTTFVKVGIQSRSNWTTVPTYTNGTTIPKYPNGTTVPKESKKMFRIDVFIIGVLCLAFSFIVLAFSAILIFRYRHWACRNISSNANEGLSDDVSMRSFTYGELEVATNGFSEQLGRGSFGIVFKGTLSNGHGQRTIAIKRLERVVGEGEVEFRNEMRSIGRIHHRNLVRLLGYCHDDTNRLLVYEYMRNGTLADYLFKPQIKPKWDERIEIILNIARGILYLHEECESQIIHCDINPNNILMDEYGCAKIADFGLAKLLMPDHSRTLTGIRGTRGYVAPEWHKNLPITLKADVYSFGVVFFVTICCRRSIDITAAEDEIVLVDWVYDCFKANEVRKLVPEEVIHEQSLERIVKIGLWCIEEEPAVRPPIKKVVQMLEGAVDIPVPPCTRSS
ncbi:G-type lectin S-receptor-like serine/threonine-protein kinase RLK1 [Morella rubra]|uniref:Receptor-like serine/threonine-protein kinase n=1 Tax=Morella rubra TaxID=262757 RepID=A0A6A1W6L9_9ROSI|nr:G-type lectin S-receptor-like serine/threonine-protein kinase RLK1 [Morella rubra]